VQQLKSDRDDLAAMFDIEFDPKTTDIGELTDTAATAEYLEGLCPKCRGKGKFVGYTGKVIGDCFACSGTGLSSPAAPPPGLKDGDCAKCMGTGNWRPGRPCFGCNGTGKLAAEIAISVEAIATAFATARKNQIGNPKLRLGSFLFSRAPDTGRNSGSIYVKDAASREYLGKVTGGKFVAAMSCDAVTTKEIVEIAADPASAAKAYGQKTNKCSVCNRTLTAGESVDLGIGPICAQNFGW
jgi:Family of unknown function (DUF6011)